MIKVKTSIYTLKGETKGEIDLPIIFESEIREDILRKAFRASTLSARHPYGSSPLAGSRRVGHTTGPGQGVSRMPRVGGSSRAVLLGNTVGGRSPHSPRSNKVLFKKINAKEKKIAIGTAIAMTAIPEMVSKRGHKFDQELKFPVVVEDNIEEIFKAKEALDFLGNLGVVEDIERAKAGTKIRAGRGKMRGRRYRTPRSMLIVSTEPSKLNAFKSIPGVEICGAKNITLKKLAPGGDGGRLVIYTESSVKQLGGN
ncbi:50S ribosomal protein L4P [mine drainage metagenome]|uniref:50S ribosomal protein L4P n=2 Tax=mine drainage metagenome TaxID=410659 RepID=T1CQN1_9ZZZZ